MHKTRLPAVLLVLLLLPLAGCASSGQSSGSGESGSESGSRDVVTRDQLNEMDNLTVYDALSRLRPTWIRSPRYSGLKVYLDGILEGGRTTLRTLQVRSVEEIRFLDPRQATTEFGTGHRGGALVITTRR